MLKGIFDSHTHLNDPRYQELNYTTEEIVKQAREVGVDLMCNVGFDLNSSKLAVKQAQSNHGVFAAVGIHPNDVHNFDIEEDIKELNDLAMSKKVVAIGEVGLDYFYSRQNREEQISWFKEQIKVAKNNNLTVMMHLRDEVGNYQAYDDALEILKEMKVKSSIVHCFTVNLEYAQKFVKFGSYISIPGVVTFNNAKDLQEAVKWIPLSNLLIETDAPYLTPVPNRGKINFPKHIVHTANKIADLKKISVDNVVSSTRLNAQKVFNV
ncbi:TatD family hydrolase [Spiroplasma alleghenense]|uniref:Mg-dependent DNase n=1 Tax=Spiroplasma alleghenense TaxID=216931 RepID=A0A345Z5D8_9MOLU|nr:TatD family hydrolase [Spiroplasma alleghenense]AXK51817.1 Mg-dependent DNase [Spiroplasma alleghenense]